FLHYCFCHQIARYPILSLFPYTTLFRSISAVTGFGLFVELSDVYVEGLVHISTLANDYYHFDAAKHRLVGERTRRSFRLGDKLRSEERRVGKECRSWISTMQYD